MCSKIYIRLVLFALPFLFNTASGQSGHLTYAVTSVHKGDTSWIAVRTLDAHTGEFSDVLLDVQDSKSTNGSVAALAFDGNMNRLWYTPMNTDQLHYIDLTTNEMVAVPDQYFSRTGRYDTRNALPISRMVIAPDGYGYTLTNDGTHLLRFATTGPAVISDLGDLQDDPQNREMTIHSICANSGGDLIADDAGSLFLITGNNHVFKIDINSRKARFVANVSGLPQKFLTSGAAVTEDGRKIIVASSVYTDSYFLIDPETWSATPVTSAHEMFETADLANGNALFTKAGHSDVFAGKTDHQNKFRLFPNPVMNDVVSVQFNAVRIGRYTIQLANLVGTVVMEQYANITTSNQTEIFHIPGAAAQGFYYVRILDQNRQLVSTQKLVVERW